MTTLVMFSGGLDSTAALYKLLTGSEDDLHVHHVHLVNRDGRARAERDAVQAVLAWCRANCRPFSYSESALDFDGAAGDSDRLSFGRLCRLPGRHRRAALQPDRRRRPRGGPR